MRMKLETTIDSKINGVYLFWINWYVAQNNQPNAPIVIESFNIPEPQKNIEGNKSIA